MKPFNSISSLAPNETRDPVDAGGLLEGCDLTITNKPYDKSFSIFRPVYSQHEFDIDHGANYKRVSIKMMLKNKMKAVKERFYNANMLKNILLSRFPFILILMKYKWKEWVFADFIAGLIVGIMHIPQGMAYAQLAGLRPVYGLYVSFFPVIIYFFLGTSRHISIGTIAIVSLMTGKYLEKSLIDYPLPKINNSTGNSSDIDQKAIQIMIASRVTSFTFFVGITQLLMGVLNMGVLTRYLSDPVISGFTVGSAMHVFTSQIKYCFGVKITKFHGVFNIINTIVAVLKKLPETNIPTIVLTIICMTLLFLTKELINPRVVKKIRIPVPMELFIVIAGTIASKYLFLAEKYKVAIVGEISRGLPVPNIPNLKHSSNYIADIIITAIIAFSVCVSLGQIFAKKHGYKINPNQEFLAYGIMNIFSSFFACYPSASSLSRSAVQESVGGKTQLTSLVSSCLLVLVLLFIGPLFEKLPSCILSSIILVALKGLFMQFGELKELWLFSIWDFSIWVATFLGTAFLDVEYGLIIGVSLSILSIMLRTQSPHSHILGQIAGTDLYTNVNVYEECHELPGIKIFRYEGSLYYACSDHFRKALYSKVQCDPRQIKSRILKIDRKLAKVEKSLLGDNGNADLIFEQKNLQKELQILKNPNIHDIIIDCSTWTYIDIVGVKTLNQVIEEYKSVNIFVSLANPKSDIRKMFYRIQSNDHIDDKIIYVSVHDAVINSLFKRKGSLEEDMLI